MSKTIYVGLGSNLNNPIEQVQQAFESLNHIPKSQVLVQSSLFKSPPMGPQDQGNFINAVAKMTSNLSALELLDELQLIDNNQGRVRKSEQWGPRTLDLDLLLFGEDKIDTERLVVPHYGMKERAFVLIPLVEVAPALILPDGTPIENLVSAIDKQGIQKL